MTAEDWRAWVSTDEAIIYLKRTLNPKNHIKWVKKGTYRPNPVPTPKHTSSVKVWGAVGGKGKKSEIFIFTETMTGAFYKDEILTKYALPFFKKILKDYPKAVLWHDNDPKHTTPVNLAFLSEKFGLFTTKPPPPCRTLIPPKAGAKKKPGRPPSLPVEECICEFDNRSLDIECPSCQHEPRHGKYLGKRTLFHAANSADLPPIENIWSLLQRNIWRGDPNITTVDQLKKAIKKAWKAITPEEIMKIQDSLPKRMRDVEESEGWPIDS